MVAWFVRILPLLVILAVIAGVVYLVMSWRYSSNRAKETLIHLFTWLNLVLTILFALGAAYAWGEGNRFVIELFIGFAATTLVALVVTRICRRVFIAHHPNYRFQPERAETIEHHWWDAFWPPRR
ncbi:MAG: guanylate cyclase [Eggerthellaceae bacterium]|jgi:CDP-diglyceride synthetase